MVDSQVNIQRETYLRRVRVQMQFTAYSVHGNKVLQEKGFCDIMYLRSVSNRLVGTFSLAVRLMVQDGPEDKLTVAPINL